MPIVIDAGVSFVSGIISDGFSFLSSLCLLTLFLKFSIRVFCDNLINGFPARSTSNVMPRLTNSCCSGVVRLYDSTGIETNFSVFDKKTES